LQITCVIC